MTEKVSASVAYFEFNISLPFAWISGIVGEMTPPPHQAIHFITWTEDVVCGPVMAGDAIHHLHI